MASAPETLPLELRPDTRRSSPRDMSDRRDIGTCTQNEERTQRAAAADKGSDSCTAVWTRVASGGASSRALPSARKVTTTHKVRALRKLVASLDRDVQQLEATWRQHVPSHRVLQLARRCAREKHAANRSEALRAQLERALFDHKLTFASLETALLRAPLHSRAHELFHALHFDTRLGRRAHEREQSLQVHYRRSLATLPAIVDEFVQQTLYAMTGGQSMASRTPVSRMDIAGGTDCTLLSGLFVSEIPCLSLHVVYAAVLAYFDSVATAMKRHFGIETRHEKLHSGASSVHYQRSSFKGPTIAWIENNIVCSELTPSHGMVHIDAVTDDPLHPVPETACARYGICCLTISPRKDSVTGKTLSVTLQWVAVHRYNKVADDPAIEKGSPDDAADLEWRSDYCVRVSIYPRPATRT